MPLMAADPGARLGAGAGALDEAADADERLLDLVLRGRVAHPHVTLARGTERATRHARDVLLGEQALDERLGVEAGRGDLREGVERAARLERAQAERVEAV